MNEDMNFEFELKKRFNDEAPELPVALEKENVMKMLEKDNFVPKKKKHIFSKVLATAAALLVTVSAIYVMPIIKPESGLVDATTQQTTVGKTETDSKGEEEGNYEVIDNGLEATKLLQAESSDDLKAHFVKLYREDKIDDFIDGTFEFFYATAEDAVVQFNGTADMMSPESAMPTMAVTSQAVAGNTSDMLTGTGNDDAYGKTNTQVENVDEADIIKNDGRYLYILSGGIYSANKRVTVVDAESMTVASKIEIKDDGYNYYIQEMYVSGDRLVLLATEHEKEKIDLSDRRLSYSFYEPYYGRSGRVVSFLYDISDRANPTFVRKVSQDGSEYISSRMVDGVLYTVSAYTVRGNSEDDVKDKAIPDVNGKDIACGSIYIYDYDSDRYILLSAYDTMLDDGEVSSLSVLGAGDEVYCSGDALYVARSNYNYSDGDYEGNYTDIYSFGLDGTKLSYKASGTVKGLYLNQFSFDEYKGNLRVATTFYSYKHDVDVSNIYVLNKDLQLIGALEDIAYDEQVKSVRFMGDTGFIVTFRNTDPLFTLDLSDPTAPKVVGEVKLPGFSSYLHPVGEGLVVGLGYDGDEENADFSSLKVSLFDVSDMKNPKEADSFVLKNVSSAALYNHKAFIYYPEENIIGFPVEHYTDRTVLSYKLLKIENMVIENHLGYVHKTERLTGDVFRGTYIGDKLYTIDNYNVCEFDIDSAVLTRECQILGAEEDIPEEGKYGEIIDDVVTSPAVMPGGVVATTQEETTVPPDYTTTTAAVTSSGQFVTQYAEYSFEAELIELYDDSGALLVEVTDAGNSGLSAGTQAHLISTGTVALEKGDTLRVVFDGVVLETYPVQIPNVFSISVN